MSKSYVFNNLMRTEVIMLLWAIWPTFMVDRLRAKSVAYQRAREHELHLKSTTAWPCNIAQWCIEGLICWEIRAIFWRLMNEMNHVLFDSNDCQGLVLSSIWRQWENIVSCARRSTCPMLPGVTERLGCFLLYKLPHLSCVRLNDIWEFELMYSWAQSEGWVWGPSIYKFHWVIMYCSEWHIYICNCFSCRMSAEQMKLKIF